MDDESKGSPRGGEGGDSKQKGSLSTHRLLGLSDGVFAIVMTILIIDLKFPQMDRLATSISLASEMKGLVDIYDQVQQVNISFARRLQGIRIQDASLNAVVILDNFGNFIKLSIDCEMLSEMDSYFHPLIDD